jgi:hypothetical protein
MGDKVYVDGVPTGFLLIHCGLLRAMWEDSEEYDARGQRTRRVFETPRKQWFDPETMQWNTQSGTSDLAWSTRVIEGDYLRKAGWGDYCVGLEDERYPFIVDTNIFTWHIQPDGQRYPREMPKRKQAAALDDVAGDAALDTPPRAAQPCRGGRAAAAPRGSRSPTRAGAAAESTHP